MSQDLLDIFLLSLLAMFNPTLLAAVTLMLFLPSPRPVMLGYLLGAYTTSIALGLVIVFSLSGSSAVSTSRNTISPAEDIVVGLLLLPPHRQRGGHHARRAQPQVLPDHRCGSWIAGLRRLPPGSNHLEALHLHFVPRPQLG